MSIENIMNMQKDTVRMMNNIMIEPLLSIVMGILILMVPQFLHYFVSVYLIARGILWLIPYFSMNQTVSP